MHSIKKAARKEAWYRQDTDDVKTFNIFGRVNTRPKAKKDVETGLYKTQTENDANSPTEDARKKSYEKEREGFEGPHKSGTYPQGPGGNMPLSRDGNEISSSSGYGESNPSTEKPNVTDADGRRPSGSEAQAADSGPRRRKGLKFWKKEETPDEKNTDGKQRRRDKFGPPPPIMSQVKAVLYSWINLLLVFVPVGFALEYAHVNEIIIFVINFLAIIPLAAMLSFATEELALYIGETLGGLLNATFGNAVELIVSVIALTQGKILIVQTSLIGSLLSNLLLVLGMCFFFGGINRVEQFFNVTVAQTAASLLALAVGSLIIPTAFQIFSEKSDRGVAPVSRGTSVLLLVTYACYLIFQLRTHVGMYNEPSQKAPKKKDSAKKEPGDAMRGIAAIGAGTGAAAATGGVELQDEEEEEEQETPQLSILGALITLAGSTVLIAFCAEFMVTAIDIVSENVSPEFIGLILLPIVGNAAEHATAVTVAIKDKLDLSIGVAIGSSLQIALLVLPFMVLLSWFGVGEGKGPGPMTLDFDGFQIAVLFIAVILVNYLIGDGKSHWLEGVLLNITYLIIALAAWFYPAPEQAAG